MNVSEVIPFFTIVILLESSSEKCILERLKLYENGVF